VVRVAPPVKVVVVAGVGGGGGGDDVAGPFCLQALSQELGMVREME
jgi:hypothetical protein